MKITFVALALVGLISAKHHHMHQAPVSLPQVIAGDISKSKSEMEEFSKDFSKTHFTTAWENYVSARDAGYTGDAPRVETWEKYDKAFKSMRARNSKFAKTQLDNLQELQERLNSSPTD